MTNRDSTCTILILNDHVHAKLQFQYYKHSISFSNYKMIMNMLSHFIENKLTLLKFQINYINYIKKY